jgi:hypothetical protein
LSMLATEALYSCSAARHAPSGNNNLAATQDQQQQGISLP